MYESSDLVDEFEMHANGIVIFFFYKEVLHQTLKIVKIFKKSPAKNDVVQKHVVSVEIV